jgi:hypothetical protein
LALAGKWLSDRHDRALLRLTLAEESLKVISKHTVEYLLSEFSKQRAYQSRPAPRKLVFLVHLITPNLCKGQSKLQGQRAIEQIVASKASVDALKKQLIDQYKQLKEYVKDTSDASNVAVQQEMNEDIKFTQQSIRDLERDIEARTNDLRLNDITVYGDLTQLLKNPWITGQLNLRVLMTQLVNKLRDRKFELEALNRMSGPVGMFSLAISTDFLLRWT